MHNSFTLPKVGIWKRLGWWILPPTRHPVPYQPVPDEYQDEIVIETVVSLRVRDRLRVLFLGRVTVETRTLTEFKPGSLVTRSGMDTF